MNYSFAAMAVRVFLLNHGRSITRLALLNDRGTIAVTVAVMRLADRYTSSDRSYANADIVCKGRHRNDANHGGSKRFPHVPFSTNFPHEGRMRGSFICSEFRFLPRMIVIGSYNGANTDDRKILVPFDKREAITLRQAAAIADKSESTLRGWCEEHGSGRRIGGGTWPVSRVALAMFLDGDFKALRAYHAGDRTSELVAPFFRRLAA
jgi:hypothetical protein